MQGAVFSRDRVHRYWLWRTFDRGIGRVAFIGLNPSTANEVRDDPTVSRCIRYAQEWGFGRLDMLNVFAFRATDPKEMRAAPDPVGPDNDEWLLGITGEVDLVVAAWGTHAAHLGRGPQVRELLGGIQLHHLGLTRGGYPYHPLYRPGARFRHGAAKHPPPWPLGPRMAKRSRKPVLAQRFTASS